MKAVTTSKEIEHRKRGRAQILRFIEKELASHPKPKAGARWAIELLASLRFKRYQKVTKGGLIRINRGAIREAVKYEGR